MEDVRHPPLRPPRFGPVSCRSLGQWLCLGLCISALAGCSLFVIAGKVLFGDPTVTSAFHEGTGVDLAEGETKVVVLCSAPSMIEDSGELSVNYEIVESVSRRLKRRGVHLIDSNEVRTWMDDNGGRLDDPRDLADDFDVDYILYISLAQVNFREPNSPSLYRGAANGEVFVYQVKKKDSGHADVHEVFSKGFSSTYPEFHPISAQQIDSLRIFQKKFLDRVSGELSQLFYDHKVSEEIE